MLYKLEASMKILVCVKIFLIEMKNFIECRIKNRNKLRFCHLNLWKVTTTAQGSTTSNKNKNKIGFAVDTHVIGTTWIIHFLAGDILTHS